MADLSAKEAENWPDQLARVRLMATGDPTWDLSDNDLAALRAVLQRLDAAVTAGRKETP